MRAMNARASENRRKIAALSMSLFLALVGCDKKPPPDPHLLRGYALLSQDPKQALQEFRQARDPQSPKAALGRGLALEGLRLYPEAKKELAAALAKKPDPAVLLPMARVELMLSEPESARKHLDQLIAQTPSNLSALLLEVCLADDKSTASRALLHLEAARSGARLTETEGKSEPDQSNTAEYHLARASLLAQLGRGRERREAQRLATSSAISSKEAALASAVLATRAGRRDLATSLLERMLPEADSWTQYLRIAQLAHLLGEHELAGKALASLPEGDDPELIVLRARHDFSTNDPGAPGSLRRALRTIDDPATRTQLRLFLAESLLRSKNLDEARIEAEKALSDAPKSPAAHLLLARLDLVKNDPDAALKRLTPLLGSANTAGVDAHELAARAHLQAGHEEEAIEILQAAVAKNPPDPHAATWLASLLIEDGKKRQAIDMAAALVERAPTDLNLRLLLLELVRKFDAPAHLAQALRESVQKMPQATRLWLQLAQFERQQRGESSAFSVIEEALRANRDDPLLTAAQAASLTAQGRTKEAAPLYARVLEHAEDDVVALNNLAMFYVDEVNEVEKGVQLAEQAYRLAPEQPPILDTLGWALYRRGAPDDLERARKLLEVAAEDLESPTSQYHLGAVLIATGEMRQGKRLLQQALTLKADFPEADEARKMLARGS